LVLLFVNRARIRHNSPMAALDDLRRHYREREQAARAENDSGGKVIGYFSNNVPVELIRAAGFFPVRLTGDPRETTETGDRYMEEFHDGDIRSIFDRTLRGHFNFCDLIVVPRTSESFLQLYYYLLEARHWEPARKFPELYLFDLLQGPGETIARYDRGRLRDLRRTLDRVAGRTMNDAAVRTAIASVNENRALLDQVNQLRRRALLSGTDMLRVYGAASFVATDVHSAWLREILTGANALHAIPGARLMLKGSPHEDDGFYQLIESCGAILVADDHTSGERAFEHRVANSGDAIAALTEHYHHHSLSPRSYPQAEQDRRFIELVEQARVRGVIFFHDEWDDVLGWDFPDQKKLLDARGIPSVFLKKQSYRAPDRAAQRDAVQGLVESIA
jgi:benzoyl-CoA reductase/2-hydroxyglutaryl-CoA dehydratase subunit BcrC/BadD/HgdB